ncbi:glutamate dehydrogenase [Mariniflexile gromovii]|uniref:Glutamate dehydrogenase n=1 Tax=Mariniflexile gromovii TaxID=362523 RepID=A0ABS4BYC2_9FLAO|nr:glutamate dehydrogenase [Mariniflexile gromovii]MBP0905582.1 glutamate dehydrogenase [Mariniflexile gromovii]
MLNFKCLAFYLCLIACYQTAFSQIGFSNEIGVVAGPVQFKSDYGVRENATTNFGNTGFGIGIVHYINFSYKGNYNFRRPNTYFEEHVKIRNEISWNKTKLEHFGQWVGPSKTSEDAKRLRAHKGYAKNLDLGTEFEFYPLEIHDFETFGHALSPFISFGAHYTIYSPEVSTTYANPDPTAVGNVTNPSNFYSLWAPGSVDASGGGTFSLVSSVGVRYKLDKLSDLMLNIRGQYYLSDFVDGLNHQLPSNKYNDWLIWINVGYIYYLN